jgi:hypothetical protein
MSFNCSSMNISSPVNSTHSKEPSTELPVNIFYVVQPKLMGASQAEPRHELRVCGRVFKTLEDLVMHNLDALI